MKRHPKKCNKYNTEKGCRYASDCSYHHNTQQEESKPCECNAKIDIFEKIVTELTKKIIDHENKLLDMKTLFKEDNEVKEKVNLCEAVVQKMFMNIIKIETEVNDLRTIIKSKDIIEEAACNMKPINEKTECKSTHEKSVKEEVKKKNDKQNNDIKCEMCKCSCKKIKIMRKHMNMKHTDNECKICDNVFTNSMDALVHTAKEHSQNITEDNPNMNVQLEKINEIPEVKENIDKASKLK